MTQSLVPKVADLLREVAHTVVLPRYQRLARDEVLEKAPGEIVTIVDRESERLLTAALTGLLPGSRVVGEEATAADPNLLHALSAGEVWLVDPLDGTRNFTQGNPDFAMMVALLRDGHTVGAWIYNPLANTLDTAQRGAGAYRNGNRLRIAPAPTASAGLRGILKTGFLPPALRDDVVARSARLRAVQPGSNCAGVDYPDVVAGTSDFALYWRTLPWDHAPGVLYLTEAGGHAARLDGSPYRAGDSQPGLLAALDAATWQRARDLLFAPSDNLLGSLPFARP
jgi:fructose-1,6-bisphosphatase/inositol monophosphatase family enzyme